MNPEYLAGKLKLARYLITRADERGFTHGEKHYLLQSALILLHETAVELGAHGESVLDMHAVAVLKPTDINEIPF